MGVVLCLECCRLVVILGDFNYYSVICLNGYFVLVEFDHCCKAL